jgi:hypothetical protein
MSISPKYLKSESKTYETIEYRVRRFHNDRGSSSESPEERKNGSVTSKSRERTALEYKSSSSSSYTSLDSREFRIEYNKM